MKFNPLKTRKGRLEQKISIELAKSTPSVENILEAIYDFEKDNIATIYKLKKVKNNDTKKISGALKQCINTHGPITKQYIGSATKRIHGSLLTTKEDKISSVSLYFRTIEFAFYLSMLYIILDKFIK